MEKNITLNIKKLFSFLLTKMSAMAFIKLEHVIHVIRIFLLPTDAQKIHRCGDHNFQTNTGQGLFSLIC